MPRAANTEHPLLWISSWSEATDCARRQSWNLRCYASVSFHETSSRGETHMKKPASLNESSTRPVLARGPAATREGLGQFDGRLKTQVCKQSPAAPHVAFALNRGILAKS